MTVRPPTPPELLARHMAAAIVAHLARLRRDHVPAPPEIVALEAFLSTFGDRRYAEDPNVDGGELFGHAPSMLLSFEDAGRELGLSARVVERLARTGELPTVTIGRSRRVRREDLLRYVTALTAAPYESRGATK